MNGLEKTLVEKISIIVPVYNVEKYLERCIESILNQSFQSFDLILVNDGSSDQSGKICENYAKTDDRIIVIHQKNAGQANARNRGIEWTLSNSESRWICFIDSDDWISKAYLEGLYEAVNKCQCSISACDFVKENRQDKTNEIVWIDSMSPSEMYNNYFYVVQSPWCKLFDKKLFQNPEFRFPEGILYEDSSIIYKIIFTQEKIAFTNKSTYYYYQRSDSSMNSEWSPRRMAYCQVQREQLQWLIDNNYVECVKTCLCYYLNTLHYNQNLIWKIPKYKKYARVMRNVCREMLKKYGRKYGFNLQTYPQFYRAAYPCLVEIYWIITAQLNKVRCVSKLIR